MFVKILLSLAMLGLFRSVVCSDVGFLASLSLTEKFGRGGHGVARGADVLCAKDKRCVEFPLT